MTLLDWLIVGLPVAVIMFIGWYVRRYIVGVSDYLVCGRICHRYVIATSTMADAIGLVTLAALVEVHYQTGFSLSFWRGFLLPLTMLLSLYGYGTYRFRQTRVMSLGQFIEMRYSRSLRIFSCFIRSAAEMAANIIMPAIAARFFINFLGLPQHMIICNIRIPTFMLIVLVLLVLAITLICMGGQLAIVITDTIQGLICLPLIAVFIVFIFYKFSWNTEILPVIADRVGGESFINPYDIKNLRDFNIFMIIVSITNSFLHPISGMTGGNNSAVSAHEAKMAGILGTWRSALIAIFYALIAICIITVMNHQKYADDAKNIRVNISQTIADELILSETERSAFMDKIRSIPTQTHTIGQDTPLSRQKNLDTVYFETAQSEFGLDGKGSSNTQQYITLFRQLMLPATMRYLLLPGMLGLFCLMIILFIISTDTGRIYSASSTLVQDCIVPFYKSENLPPERHILWIRLISIGVGIFFFFGSFYMAQLDYIQLFVQVVYGMWMGGCGPMLTFGLYGRFGTAAGAWASLLSGMFTNFFGIILQRNWADEIYPWLEQHQLVDAVGNFLSAVSRPFNPWIVWEMNRLRFPINSYEIYFIAMLTSLVVYVIVSYLTCRRPFNLDQMLHRGIYAVEGEDIPAPKLTWKALRNRIIGITPEYTRGDKVIAWSVIFYTFIYKFFAAFVIVLIWNVFMPWKVEWWGSYFFVTILVIPGICALLTTVWFSIGSTIDLYRMFRDLRNRIGNPLDNGMVEGHVSLVDKARFDETAKKQEEKQ